MVKDEFNLEKYPSGLEIATYEEPTNKQAGIRGRIYGHDVFYFRVKAKDVNAKKYAEKRMMEFIEEFLELEVLDTE